MNGAIDMSALLGLLLPLYKVADNGYFYGVPWYRLIGWQRLVFLIVPLCMVICGIVQMALAGKKQERECRRAYKREHEGKHEKRIHVAERVGMAAHISAIVLLILCGHPYPAVLFFSLFVMKGILLGKKCQ